MEPVIEIKNISKSFSRNEQNLLVLENINLQVSGKEFVSLIGPSGCGKSTIFNIISGQLLPEEGQVLMEGSEVTGKPGLVGYMPQKDLLLPWRRIMDNIILPLELQGMKKKDAYGEAMPLLPLFELSGFENNYPHQLSGGMRQRAALLRTYLAKKKVMLLDEPFGSLDALTKRKLYMWLQGIWSQFKPTIIFITHDIDEALFLSDRIYVLSERPAIIREEIIVPFPRPRTKEVLTDVKFIKLKKELLQLIL